MGPATAGHVERIISNAPPEDCASRARGAAVAVSDGWRLLGPTLGIPWTGRQHPRPQNPKPPHGLWPAATHDAMMVRPRLKRPDGLLRTLRPAHNTGARQAGESSRALARHRRWLGAALRVMGAGSAWRPATGARAEHGGINGHRVRPRSAAATRQRDARRCKACQNRATPRATRWPAPPAATCHFAKARPAMLLVSDGGQNYCAS